jgi:hypothetical protein
VFADRWVPESRDLFLVADDHDILFPDADGQPVLSPVFSQGLGESWTEFFSAALNRPTTVEAPP